MSGLSDLHPIVVHLPVVCLTVAPMFDAIGLTKRWQWGRHAGLILLAMGAAGAATAALIAHPHPSPGLVRLRGATDNFNAHELLAYLTTALSATALIVRLAVLRFSKPGRWQPILFLAVGLVLAGLVGLTGYFGGELTFQHGLGVHVRTGAH